MTYAIFHDLLYDAIWVVFVAIGLMIPLCGIIEILHSVFTQIRKIFSNKENADG